MSRLNLSNGCYHSVQIFILPSVVQKRKYKNIQDYNFACNVVGSETWSLTLSEEHRLRVFEKRVLRRIFGPKRDEATEGWRKNNEELHKWYSSPSIIRMIMLRRIRLA
jgi:hypothetical protein